MLNQFNIAGHVGNLTERTTDNGTTIAQVSVATERRRKRGDKWESVTDWHQITLFGRDAERAAKHIKPGYLIVVSGELRPTRYEKDGTTRYGVDLVAQQLSWKPKK